MWDHVRAITDCFFLSDASSESVAKDVQSYPLFGLAVVDGLEIQPDLP